MMSQRAIPRQEGAANSLSLMRQAVMLLLFLLLCQGVGIIGALLTAPEIDGWYQTLNKPSFTPPSVVFYTVWPLLFVFIGVSGWLVWRRVGVGQVFIPYALQLILNAAWSWLFFHLHRPDWALWELLLLIAAVGVNVAAFARISRLAAGLLLPYLAWLCFALVLNGWIAASNG